MSSNKTIHIVSPNTWQAIFASIEGVKDLNKSDKLITWKKRVIKKEDVQENPFRLLLTLKDEGELIELSKKTMITYTFKKSEVGKYIKFYAYINEFKTIQQCTVFYVEDKCNTNVRIRGVEQVGSDTSEIAVGQKIKLKINKYSVEEKKVSASVKKNIKWMVKIGNNDDKRLIIDGVVLNGDEIEFFVPEEWAEKDILIMPYLNIHTAKISISFKISGYILNIKTLTPLHKGSTNDGTSNEQDGLIYGEFYEFEVEFSPLVKEPDNENKINWEYSYKTDGAEETVTQTAIGKKIKIKIDDLKMLGDYMVLIVYIGEKNINNHLRNEIKLWIHYRFRWIDRKSLLYNMQKKMKYPHTIDQKKSSLCGFAFIGYHFAEKFPSEYESYIENMHRTGKYVITHTLYQVEIDDDEHLVELKPNDPKFPMSLADYILLVTLRDYKNILWDYDPDGSNAGKAVEGATGITFPHTMESLMKNVLGFNSIIDETNLSTSKWNSVKNSVNEMQKKLNEGYVVAWFINANAIIYSKKDFFSIPDHWVGLESVSLSGNTVSYRIYTWGGFKDGTIDANKFKDGNYGYVAAKK